MAAIESMTVANTGLTATVGDKTESVATLKKSIAELTEQLKMLKGEVAEEA